MSGWWFKLFMIMYLINPVPAHPQPQPGSSSEAILLTAPPPPYRLLPVARLSRIGGVALPAPNFDSTPFGRRVELPLAQFWGGRLTIIGFHSDVIYSGASLGDPHFRSMRMVPGDVGAPRSSSYGVRITISSKTSSATVRAESQPR